MTLARLAAPTLFGKLPSCGDFVGSGERGDAEHTFAAWLTQAVEAARGRVPAPLFFVASQPRAAMLAGCWVESRDAVGRHFPLVVSRSVSGALPEGSLAFLLHEGERLVPWAERVSTTALQQGTELSVPAWGDLVGPSLCTLSDLRRRANDALTTTSVHTFAATSFAHAPLDNLTYALSVLQRASRLPAHDLTLDVPAPSYFALFVWLELRRAFYARAGSSRGGEHARVGEPSMVLWSPALRRALVCLGPWSTELLVYLGDAQHQGHERWPLWTERSEATLRARSELHPGARACLERNDTVAALLARVARGER